MKIVLFNGPPRCGKDTAARYLASAWSSIGMPGGIDFLRMSQANKRAFAGLVDAEIDRWGEVESWENIKDQPHWLLNDKSYRQWQIEFSEKFMKPTFGEDVFGRLFLNTLSLRHGNLRDCPIVTLVPDSGFEIEIDSLVTEIRPSDIMLIRVHRAGCDFSKDSRSYLLAAQHDINRYDISNNGSLGEYYDGITKVLRDWLT